MRPPAGPFSWQAVFTPCPAAEAAGRRNYTMASGKTYAQFILEQLSDLGEVALRPMMGEFLLYYRGRLAGGIYDDRLLIKPVPAALAYLPGAVEEAPYPGAKPLLRVDEVDDRSFLAGLFRAIYPELPAPKGKAK